MTIVEEYRTRIREASSPEQKKRLAAKLHQLADSFDAPVKEAYEQAMNELRLDIANQLNALEPVVQRAEAILRRHLATTN